MGFGDYFIYENMKFSTGDRVECVINLTSVEDAKIYVCSVEEMEMCLVNHHANDHFERIFYICQKFSKNEHSTFICPNKLGYSYAHAAGLLKVGHEDGTNRITDGIWKLKRATNNQMILIVEQAFKCKELNHA